MHRSKTKQFIPGRSNTDNGHSCIHCKTCDIKDPAQVRLDGLAWLGEGTNLTNAGYQLGFAARRRGPEIRFILDHYVLGLEQSLREL